MSDKIMSLYMGYPFMYTDCHKVTGLLVANPSLEIWRSNHVVGFRMPSFYQPCPLPPKQEIVQGSRSNNKLLIIIIMTPD